MNWNVLLSNGEEFEVKSPSKAIAECRAEDYATDLFNFRDDEEGEETEADYEIVEITEITD